jgi:hypothetical protein
MAYAVASAISLPDNNKMPGLATRRARLHIERMPFHSTLLLFRTAARNPGFTIEQVEQAVLPACILKVGGLPLIDVAVRVPALAKSASIGTAKGSGAVLGIITPVARGGSLAVVNQ